MSRYWSQITKRIKPYVPGEQPRDRTYIKLNTNENPYPPSPRVIEAIISEAGEVLRRYPDPQCTALRQTVAQYYGLEVEQVFCGNGSDELLAFSFLAFFNPGTPILFPDITYSFYPVYCTLYHLDYELVPLDTSFQVPVEKFFEVNGGIVLANPNAPTGSCLPVSSLRDILEHNLGSVVIIDEAYIDFGGETARPLLKDFPNLLIIQTLSKSRSLAGLRVGFALGHQELIEGLRRVKDSFNSYTLDRLALAGGIAALEDDAYYRDTITKVIATRERIASALKDAGFFVVPSQANFLFLTHPAAQAADLYQQLRDRGVLVRHFNLPRIDNYLRVSIGTDEEMDIFLGCITELVGAAR
ncbi:MAG: histidinol-phosphate transaminase [Desulfobacterota bacterium]|nr:histidinol-phosphate transaminase [Thermodesulfobacteriota bacterium]